MTIFVLALLSLIALGFLSLSAVTVRSSGQSRYELEARANARLAMMIAIGELQRFLGPDQRVSAPASILDSDPSTLKAEEVAHPNWTGVWKSHHADGESMWIRDDANGGLRDRRFSEGWVREGETLSYLVSGNEGGRELAYDFEDALGGGEEIAEEERITLVGEGSVGAEDRDKRVTVRRVAVGNGSSAGHYAYWVGDQGTKANLATANRHPGLNPPRVSQAFNAQMVSEREAGGPEVDEEDKKALVLRQQLELLDGAGREWMKEHFHDVTVFSSGVLADVRAGGLKKDLTAYLHSNGRISSRGRLAGLSDSDHLVGPANQERAREEGVNWDDTAHQHTSPRFGLLRSWLKLSQTGGAGRSFSAVVPKSEPRPNVVALPRGANVNLNPATIAELDSASLTPVLVEGSIKTNLSTHLLPNTPWPVYQTRLHLYPRVVLWNPYSVEITLGRSVIMMQVNGRKEYRMRMNALGGGLVTQLVWLWAGRNSVVENVGDFWAHYENPYAGSVFYALPETVFGPGECLVFTCPRTGEVNGDNLLAEELSCEVYPDPNRNFYSTNNSVTGGFRSQPLSYWEEPVNGLLFGREADFARNQADDYQMVLKALDGQSSLDHEEFDQLPLITHVSCSLQYGAGKEPRVAWSRRNPVPMEFLDYNRPVVNSPPDVRTRDGFRMRWFLEHQSNQLGSGPMRRSLQYFDEAHFANWNPRAAYFGRSPWANIGGDLPVVGFGGGPWFFGIFTRDLFDEEVGWASQLPVWKDGRAHGNPFGPPQDPETYKDRYILFDVPRVEDGIQSLAEFQHVKLSEFGWHPSLAIGQSLVDPRVGKTGTNPSLESVEARKYGGWAPEAIGWSNDAQRSTGRDEWAEFARAFYQNYPETDLLVYDLSYEVNHTLWDAFFVSTARPSLVNDFLEDAAEHPLPNGRHGLAPATRGQMDRDRLLDFHRAAYHLMADGMFNVNSTSVAAWKALLASMRSEGASGFPRTPFPRFAEPLGDPWDNGQAGDEETWTGNRVLSDGELQRLAEEIVYQVKRRGPFLSLADFVNRRLVDDETGTMGALQAAIDAAGLNLAFEEAGVPYAIDNDSDLGSYRHPDNIEEPVRLKQTLKPASKLWGTPGYLTQGDVLQAIGSAISVRSDTFVIRCYGDAVDASGAVKARAWCEAVVQRTPQPLHPDDTGLNSERQGEEDDFGRRFTIQSFRWLAPAEV